MGKINIVMCKRCGTEWEMHIGPVMMTPPDTVFSFRCDECGKEVKMAWRDVDYSCECGGWFEYVANEEERHCPKCGGEEYDMGLEIMAD